MRSSTRIRLRRSTSEQRILDATLALLHGGDRFDDLAVERIIGAAGVSRSTFYGYFADKTELLVRLAEPLVSEFTALADRWWYREAGGSWQSLAEQMGDFLACARSHRVVFDALAGSRALQGITDAYAERMADRLTREQAHGAVSPDVLPVVTARFIIAATLAAIGDHLARGAAADDTALASTLGHAFWFTMYGR